MLFLLCSCVVVGGYLWTSLGVEFVLRSLFAASCSLLVLAILPSIMIRTSLVYSRNFFGNKPVEANNTATTAGPATGAALSPRDLVSSL
jgi:hypothetical protein